MVDHGSLLDVEGLSKHFPIKQGFFRRVVGYTRAVNEVSFSVSRGETLGIVGESGCGKTTLGRTLLRLYERTAGSMRFHIDEGTLPVELLTGEEMKLFRRRAQIIFQDPFASLNPRMNILETVGEPLLVNNVAKGKELEERVAGDLRCVAQERRLDGAGAEGPGDSLDTLDRVPREFAAFRCDFPRQHRQPDDDEADHDRKDESKHQRDEGQRPDDLAAGLAPGAVDTVSLSWRFGHRRAVYVRPARSLRRGIATE